MIRKSLVGALAALTFLVPAGCGSQPPAAPTHNDADVTFAREMIPHHQGALDMAKLAEGRTANPELLALAKRVEQAQEPEIRTLTAWLREWGANPSADHGAHGTGSGLDSLEGERFDRKFLELMIVHHQDAVEMARTELAEGRHQPAKDLAQRIVAGQEAEIGEMQGLLEVAG
ncbi:DUF305 domain-containing protein [Actinosynnema sp. NPDC047251]|uniref:Putative secreted protein n=1 Tax=Saccharothrix espanaensis (strain ATCC 51144 / DSM 44229 / JCM 9112 / NBRC 15066 / NRRL 15764) TaxID=1179773 RepID=K0JQX3_SACES|nr:DUF305 domain-containing protein [Saccharothrix espanaensis]CCH29945.1 putative secreted protein [Saccharothrix espanaensis DSM 44229]